MTSNRSLKVNRETIVESTTISSAKSDRLRAMSADEMSAISGGKCCVFCERMSELGGAVGKVFKSIDLVGMWNR